MKISAMRLQNENILVDKGVKYEVVEVRLAVDNKVNVTVSSTRNGKRKVLSLKKSEQVEVIHP